MIARPLGGVVRLSWVLGHMSGNFGASSLGTAFTAPWVPTPVCRVEGGRLGLSAWQGPCPRWVLSVLW